MKHLIGCDHLAKLVNYGKLTLKVVTSIILMLLSLFITVAFLHLYGAFTGENIYDLTSGHYTVTTMIIAPLNMILCAMLVWGKQINYIERLRWLILSYVMSFFLFLAMQLIHLSAWQYKVVPYQIASSMKLLIGVIGGWKVIKFFCNKIRPK